MVHGQKLGVVRKVGWVFCFRLSLATSVPHASKRETSGCPTNRPHHERSQLQWDAVACLWKRKGGGVCTDRLLVVLRVLALGLAAPPDGFLWANFTTRLSATSLKNTSLPQPHLPPQSHPSTQQLHANNPFTLHNDWKRRRWWSPGSAPPNQLSFQTPAAENTSPNLALRAALDPHHWHYPCMWLLLILCLSHPCANPLFFVAGLRRIHEPGCKSGAYQYNISNRDLTLYPLDRRCRGGQTNLQDERHRNEKKFGGTLRCSSCSGRFLC